MAKKFSKFLAFSLLTGAAAAGTYYYLKKKQEEPLEDMDDFDDFDDFDDDFDEDFDETPVTKNRSYVSLDLENAKDIISEKVLETLDKAKEKFEEFDVPGKIDKAKEKIEELTGKEDKTSVSFQSTVSENPEAEYTVIDNGTTDEATTVEPSVEKQDITLDNNNTSDEQSVGHVEEFFDDSDDE